MSQTLFGRIARPAVMFVAGVLAASALSSTVVAAPATVASTLTRVTSCAGMNFHPIDSATQYEWTDRTLHRKRNTGDGWFICDPNLPNKATVTKVRFTLFDAISSVNVRYCGLTRSGLVPTNASSADPVFMGSVPDTGMNAGPGTVRVSDTSIDHATIDESNYAYYLQCRIDLEDGQPDGGLLSAGIIGADVTYKISSTNG